MQHRDGQKPIGIPDPNLEGFLVEPRTPSHYALKEKLNPTRSFSLCVSVAWLFLCSTSLFALDYSNAQFGFSATLPNGLVDVSKTLPARSFVSLAQVDHSKKGVTRLISLQDLGGTIGRKDLSKRVDKPANATQEKAPWKTFQIDVFRIFETFGATSMVTFNAQVPLKPHAVQIVVCGPASDENELRKEMQAIVASVEGPSNWLTREESFSRVASGLGRLIAFGCLLVIGIVVAVRRLTDKRNTG